MADSLTSPGLIKAANDAIVGASPDLNIARLFAFDMSPEFAEYGTTVKVPVANSGTVEDFDQSSNDFEHQDGTVTYAPVVLNKAPKSTFEFKGLDKLEAPNAPYWAKVREAAANGVKASISTTLGGLFTAAGCTGGKVVLASVTKAGIAGLRAQCAGRVADTVLALEPGYYNALLSLLDANILGAQDAIRTGYIGGLYGFKAVVQMLDLPEGVKGAIIPADAVAVASRAFPVGDEGCYSEYGTVSDEYGFALTVLRHGSAAKGKGFLNVISLWGAALVQPSKIKYIAAS